MGDLMNVTELIAVGIAIVVLLALLSEMPQYSFVFLFLLALAIVYLLMMLLARFRTNYENHTLSILFYAIGVILFIMYFVNSVFMDFTNKGTTSDSFLILALFVATIFLGWFFEEKKD